VNFYEYVRNEPVSFIDPSGMQKIGRTPLNPNNDTIVCNGHGGIRVQLGDHSKYPPEAQCIIQCEIVHEEFHIGYALGQSPTVCFGEKDMTKVVPRDIKEGAEGEVSASNVELACLENLKTKIETKPCPSCSPKVVEKRIEQVKHYRALNRAIALSLEPAP